MERAAQASNEAYYVRQIADLIRQHKEILEAYRANLREASLKARLNGQISYYDDVLDLITGYLKTLERRQRRQRVAALFQEGLLQTLKFIFTPRNFVHLVLLVAVLLCFSTACIHFFATLDGTAQKQVPNKQQEFPAQPHTQPQMHPQGLVDSNMLKPLPKGVHAERTTSQNARLDFGKRVVGNTGGLGVRYRLEPFENAPSHMALEEGRQVSLLSKQLDAAGVLWWKVRLPESGEVGYIRDDYLLK